MKKKGVSILIACLILVGIPVMAQSASVTKSFIGTVSDGLFTGYIGTGSFTYNDSLVINGDEKLTPTHGLEVSFSFDGQSFDQTNDADYDNFPKLFFKDSVPVDLDCILEDGRNGVDFNDPNLVELATFDLIPYSGSYDFEIDIYADSIPIPGALWLLGSGFMALVGIRKRFKKA